MRISLIAANGAFDAGKGIADRAIHLLYYCTKHFTLSRVPSRCRRRAALLNRLSAFPLAFNLCRPHLSFDQRRLRHHFLIIRSPFQLDVGQTKRQRSNDLQSLVLGDGLVASDVLHRHLVEGEVDELEIVGSLKVGEGGAEDVELGRIVVLAVKLEPVERVGDETGDLLSGRLEERRFVEVGRSQVIPHLPEFAQNAAGDVARNSFLPSTEMEESMAPKVIALHCAA